MSLSPHHIERFMRSETGRTSRDTEAWQAIVEAFLESGAAWEELDVEDHILLGLALAHIANANPEEISREDAARRSALLLAASSRVSSSCEVQHEGVSLSPYPTPHHTSRRHMLLAHIAPVWRPLFVASCGEIATRTVQVFVDPVELHFRTFEYILPLDHYFEALALEWSGATDTGAERPDETLDLHTFGCELDHDSMRALVALDRAGLYLTPLNRASRGGERLIFHSARLADSLTEMMRAQLPAALMEGFVHVNPVFRLNRFASQTQPFREHYDAPFSDLERGHISRYTVLLYLTGGDREQGATLRVEGHRFQRFDRLTCVVFHQGLAHEGAAFDSSVKLFLRTELIFEATSGELVHDQHLAEVFSRACALTSESLLDEEMANTVHALHDRAARLRWHGTSTPEARRMERATSLLHKRYGKHEFVTDGCRYWFTKAQRVHLEACAALVVLDYFNCKIDETSFRKLCSARKIKKPKDGHDTLAWPIHYLEEVVTGEVPERECKVGPIDPQHLTPRLPKPDASVAFPSSLYELNDGIIRGLDVAKYVHQEHILELMRASREAFLRQLQRATILMLGEEVFLREDRILVHGNQILFGADKPLRQLNFAAATTYTHEPSDYVDRSEAWHMPHLLLPPILFRLHDGGFELVCDFFRSGWMASCADGEPVVAPRLNWPW